MEVIMLEFIKGALDQYAETHGLTFTSIDGEKVLLALVDLGDGEGLKTFAIATDQVNADFVWPSA
jgi:hypothetical protein